MCPTARDLTSQRVAAGPTGGEPPTAESGTEAPGFDPFELPDTIQFDGIDDPYPHLAAARRQGDVVPGWPFPVDLAERDADAAPGISVVGHDAVVAVLRDHETYSSQVLADIMGPMLGHTIIAMDEPEHRAHRALVAPAFRPRLLARWEQELVRRVLDELLDSFVGLGRVDLVRRLTFAFPVRVIARILGLPDRDSHQFQRWSIELISMVVNWERGMAASTALREYFAEQVAARRAKPSDDLISDLVEVEVDGKHLTDEDIFAFLRLLLPAGIETTYRSLGNLLFALLTHADQLEEIVRCPELRPSAIEEGLRWESPVVLVLRRCLRDTQLAGTEIPAGRDINVFLASANRDEQRYTDPVRFDIHRTPSPHVSFGSGPHMCLGMHLARMETRIALDAVVERLHDLRIDRDRPHPKVVGTAFRSPESLPVCFSA